MYTSSQTKHWLDLSLVKGISIRNKIVLVEKVGGVSELYLMSENDLQQIGLEPYQAKSVLQIDKYRIAIIESNLKKNGDSLVCYGDKNYPSLLRQISDPPLVLYCRGDTSILNTPQIAIVGSRKPSTMGSMHANEFAAECGSNGLTVTSGMAYGIDAAAHTGALETGSKTIAVWGSGLDRCYPRAHKKLAHDIAKNGLIISEYAYGTPPIGHQFPRRNRIISGLSLGVLVVEAGLRSGALNTANHAVNQNKEVFAIPGSIRNTNARGCHHLISQGAKLTQSVSDILVELESNLRFKARGRHFYPEAQNWDSAELSDSLKKIIRLLDDTPVPLDILIERSGIQMSELTPKLLELEIMGAINSTANGEYYKVEMG